MASESAVPGDRVWLYHPEFPDHWERWPLYSMARWVNGLAFRDSQFTATGMPVIKIAEIKGGISGQTKFTQQAFDESVRVRPGDLLFSWSGQPDTSIDAFWWRGPEGWLNQHVFRVTPSDRIDPTFFYYLLRYLKPNFVGIARNKQTTGLGHVTKRDLENIEAAYPEPPEQRAIAHILGTLDDKIELNRRMAATLEEMARAIFKSWFIDFDPIRAKAEGRPTHLPPEIDALFPDSFEDSELGPIPRGWRIGSIAELATVGGGSTPSTKNPEFWDGEFAWATPKDLSKLSHPVLLETERSITEAGLKSISSGLYTPGTVLMSSRAPIGYLAITEIPVAVNQGFIALQPSVECGNLYLLRWLEFNMDAIHGRANGSTFMEISKSAFRSIETVLPSNDIVEAFSGLIDPSHRRLVQAVRESASLATIRDLLLPKLFSGELSPTIKEMPSNG